MGEGWIKLYRKINGCMFWGDKPFDRARAWIDLLLMANYEDNTFLFGNEIIEVKRGSFITSEHKLMARWGWSKTKVRSFLSVLEDAKMLIKKTDHKKTTLTLVNYGVYQDSQTTEEPVKDQKKTSKRPVKDPSKKDKKDKNEKKVFKDYVLLTDEEYQKLVDEYGLAKILDMIERLNDYAFEKPKKFKEYACHYRTIKNWIRMEKERNGGQAPKQNTRPLPRAFESIRQFVEEGED